MSWIGCVPKTNFPHLQLHLLPRFLSSFLYTYIEWKMRHYSRQNWWLLLYFLVENHLCIWIQRSLILHLFRGCFVAWTSHGSNVRLIVLHLLSCWTSHSCRWIRDCIMDFSWNYLSKRGGFCGSYFTSSANSFFLLSLKSASWCWSLLGDWAANYSSTASDWPSSVSSTVSIFCGISVGSPSTTVRLTSPIIRRFLSLKVRCSGWPLSILFTQFITVSGIGISSQLYRVIFCPIVKLINQ